MKDYVEIIFILDGSGSMGPMASEAISGYNNFVKKQQNCPAKPT